MYDYGCRLCTERHLHVDAEHRFDSEGNVHCPGGITPISVYRQWQSEEDLIRQACAVVKLRICPMPDSEGRSITLGPLYEAVEQFKKELGLGKFKNRAEYWEKLECNFHLDTICGTCGKPIEEGMRATCCMFRGRKDDRWCHEACSCQCCDCKAGK